MAYTVTRDGKVDSTGSGFINQSNLHFGESRENKFFKDLLISTYNEFMIWMKN